MSQVKYPALSIAPATGNEPFTSTGRPTGLGLIDFWRWSASALTDNTMRGILAEFLVASALGRTDRARLEWDSYDVTSLAGLKIEVKSASRWQTWAQQRPSPIRFGIRPKKTWIPETGKYVGKKRRQADLYVFALLDAKAKAELDPLKCELWTFYVLATKVLDDRVPEQQSITLGGLLSLGATNCRYEELGQVINKVSAADRLSQ